MQYTEITQIKSRNQNPIFPHMVLISDNRTLRINRRIDKLAELYSQLLALTKLPQETSEPISPIRLRLRKNFILSNSVGFVILVAISIALLVSFSVLGSRPLQLILMMSILFTTAITVISVLFIHQEGLLTQPLAFDFDVDEIRFFILGKGWQSWSSRELASITTQVEKTPIQGGQQGINISENKIQTHIVLRFQDDRELTISERRCWQCGFGPEALIHLLKDIYPWT
jgi:hypothetical protein